jgi:hypothetical protein
MIRDLVIAALLALTSGCRTGGGDASVFHSWGSEEADELRARLDHYRHVLLVCAYEDHWEDRGPNRYSLFHAKATVVRVYKGDWQVSEKMAWVHGLDDRAPANPKSAAGRLFFLFTNEHTDAEIGLDTGEFTGYGAEHALALQRIDPHHGSP